MLLEVYFDYSSPFAYLATTQVDAVCSDTGAELVYRPFFLGGLFNAIGTPLVPIANMSDARRRYMLEDLYRWREQWDVPLNFPSRFPLNTLAALRLSLAAGSPPSLVRALMRAYWVEDADPTDGAVLARALDEASLDRTLLERIGEPEIKAKLKAETEGAAARGVFGAPTFFIGPHMFWGQDRLDHVRKVLLGWAPRGAAGGADELARRSVG